MAGENELSALGATCASPRGSLARHQAGWRRAPDEMSILHGAAWQNQNLYNGGGEESSA